MYVRQVESKEQAEREIALIRSEGRCATDPCEVFTPNGKIVWAYSAEISTPRGPRGWDAGIKVMDQHGNIALLLAPVWSQFAWIVYEGQMNPVTVLACNLTRAKTATESQSS
jgi:hypothetical protein